MSDELHQDSELSTDHDQGGSRVERLGRRALVLGAATGAGVAVGLVAGAAPAIAAAKPDGGDVLLGERNRASATTAVFTETGDGLKGQTTQDGKTGVHGVDASSGGGQGVLGSSTAGYGVKGQSANGTGVYGTITGDTSGQSAIYGDDASSGGGFAVYGMSANGSGVWGAANNGNGVTGVSPGGVGVFGSSSNGDGVYAQSLIGRGVNATGVYGVFAVGTVAGVHGTTAADTGTSGTAGVIGIDISNGAGGGFGVYAQSEIGTGIYGTIFGDSSGQSAVHANDASTGGGYGVFATSLNGMALAVDGSASFSGVTTFSRSGVATVAANESSATVTDVALTDTSIVLATVQGDVKKVSVEGVVTDPSSSEFTIYLTNAPTASLAVGWFVIG